MIIGERYEILEKIGTGGMSDVYKAKCHKLNRFVAVKVLKSEFSENKSFVSKFWTEAQAAAGLMHPNIVNVYDVGEEYDIYYIVMELVEGITLKDYIEKKARLSIKEAISIAIQVSMGIEAAHNNHIIHRDIKPQNIIISKEGKVKVTDFGIARAATSDTITSNAMGSVHYTSPEQARGGYSDAKSDIYSLGITLFEMLTGRVPFDGETTVSIAIKHIQEEFPSPRNYIPEIPLSVEQIIFKCTQKNPDRRYGKMEELIGDLKRSLLTPDEDFVKMIPLGGEGETKAISDEDMKKIKRHTGNIEVELPPYHMVERVKEDEEEDYEEFSDEDYYEDDGYYEEDEEYYEEDEEYESDYYEEEDEYDSEDEDYYEEDGYYEDEDYYEDGYEKEGMDPKMDKLMTVLAIVAVLIVGSIAIFLAGKAIGFFKDGARVLTEGGEEEGQIPMISVTGIDFEEAKAKLNELELGVQETYENSNEIEKGKVISQDKEEGTLLDKHTTIGLVVSLGKGGIEIPSVVGKTEAEGKVALEEEGFVVEKEYSDSDTVEEKLIISQRPGAGANLEKGGTVTIVISTGKSTQEIEMPELRGQTEANAKLMLSAARVLLGKIEEAYSDEYPLGTVAAQSYTPGTKVAEGTSVDLVISLGSQNVTYKCSYSVIAPAGYTGGTAQIAVIRDDTGEILHTASTEVFPYPLNLTGIAGEDPTVLALNATVTITYMTDTSAPGVDEAGNPTVITTTEQRAENQPILLTKE